MPVAPTPKVSTVAAPTTAPAVPLPNWNDPTSITAWIVSVATFILSVLTMAGVTVPGATSTNVSTWAGIAGIAIAAGFAIANFIRVTVLHKAAISAGHPVAIRPTKIAVAP